MKLSILLLIFLGHLLSDFPLQSSSLVSMRYDKRRENRFIGNITHSAVHFIVYLILLIGYMCEATFWLILLLSAFHFLIDMLKSYLVIVRPLTKYSTGIFLIDQALHLVLILWISYDINISNFTFLNINIIREQTSLFLIPFEYDHKLLLTGCLLAAGTWGVGAFINIFIDHLKIKLNEENINKNVISAEVIIGKKKSPDAGYIIGVLERLLIICAVVFNTPSIIGFAIAAKSIARFKEFDDDWFVKVFIIGSFISFISAIAIGVVISGFNIFPKVTEL